VQEHVEAIEPPAPATCYGNDAELLAELRKLPEAFPGQPVLWVPRRSKQAASSILCDLLAKATQHGEDAEGQTHAEIAHRLIRAAGQILFRPPVDDVVGLQSSDDEHRGLALLEIGCARLLQVNGKSWLQSAWRI